MNKLLCIKSLYKSTYNGNAFDKDKTYEIIRENEHIVWVRDNEGKEFSFGDYQYSYKLSEYFDTSHPMRDQSIREFVRDNQNLLAIILIIIIIVMVIAVVFLSPHHSLIKFKMEFIIIITKEVIDKSLRCGTSPEDVMVTKNCAFALAYRELIPHTFVGNSIVEFYKDEPSIISSPFGSKILTKPQVDFIREFDFLRVKPLERYQFVGRTFEVEIPDEVIEYHYGDAVKAVQKLIDNPVLKPAL